MQAPKTRGILCHWFPGLLHQCLCEECSVLRPSHSHNRINNIPFLLILTNPRILPKNNINKPKQLLNASIPKTATPKTHKINV